MSEESKKVEQAEKAQQEVKPAELSEQELDKVAGGGTTGHAYTSRSNIRNS
jgi:hypothetical protein